MRKNIGDLKNAIASTMNRDQSAFVAKGQNNLVIAVNNAKDFCQRAINFEYAKEQIFVNVNLQNGGSLDSAIKYGTTSESVQVKTLRQAYLPLSDGSSQIPVKMISREQWAQRRMRVMNGINTLNVSEARQRLESTGFAVVLDGQNIYIDPPNASNFNNQTIVKVYFDCLRWLPDFVTHGDAAANDKSNFLLQYCFDFMLYRSIHELNFFLKEDQRVPIAKALLDEVWQNVIEWNASIVGSAIDVSLD